MRALKTWLALGLGMFALSGCDGSSKDPGSETDIPSDD